MKIMGIINLSDDSFSETGKFTNIDDALVSRKQALLITELHVHVLVGPSIIYPDTRRTL